MASILLTVKDNGRCSVALLEEGGITRPWIIDADVVQAIANVKQWAIEQATKGE